MPSRETSSTLPARTIVFVTIAALVLAVLYIIGHAILISLSELNVPELIAMSLLIGCEIFMFLHAVAYFSNVAHVNAHAIDPKRIAATPAPLTTFPPVALAICSYREPLTVLEANMICFRNLTYPNKRLFLLDDTPYDDLDKDPALARYRADLDTLARQIGINVFRHKWRGAKAGMINDFLNFLGNRDEPGFEMAPNQNGGELRDAKYLAIFDADMNPLPDFAELLVAHLEADDRLAFVQTPQFYSNITTNRVANGAAAQQAVFYEYICEGKGMLDTMPCCGTNVMFRIAALEDVGGMDETSVTEDFATSIKLHLRGWRSTYVNRVCAFGMGPQDLGSFFKQQFRWASGTVGLLRMVMKEFFRNPRAFSPRRWLEYFASVSFYCVGWVWLIIWSFPVLYVFLGFPRSLARPEVFFALFIPYLAFTFWAFIGSLRYRGYSTADVFSGMTMNVISFPIYMMASACGLLGIRGKFRVTSKEGATSLPLLLLWPQLAAFCILVVTVAWGLNHVIYGTLSPAAVFGNIIWCAYNAAMIGTILYFNRPTGKVGLFRRERRLKSAKPAVS